MTDVGSVDGSDGTANKGVVFAQLGMAGGNLIVKASVMIFEGFSMQVQMQGRNIPAQNFDFGALNSVSSVSNLITVINSRSICCGNNDDKFLPLIEARKGTFMGSSVCV